MQDTTVKTPIVLLKKSLNGTRASSLHFGGITRESLLDLYARYSNHTLILTNHMVMPADVLRSHAHTRIISQ